MLKRARSLFGWVWLWAGLAVCGHAQEWTRFRGPNGAGLSLGKSIPSRWTESDFNWKLELPGGGHSSPVLWGDKLFLTSAKEGPGGFVVLCVSATEGRVLWQRDFSFPAHRLHRYNSYASSSPAVDQDHVYVSWTTPKHYMLVALSHDGDKVWERDLGPFSSEHGGGASPVVQGNKVILGNEQDEKSFIVAVEAKTGATVWETPRQSDRAAYCTPFVYEPLPGKTQLLFCSQAHGIYALDLDTGQVLWEYRKAFDKRTVCSPVAAAGLVFASCGSGGGGNYVVAVKPPAGPGSEATLAYEIRRSAPYVPTSVALGDLLFLWSDGGIVTCLHAPTGQIKWSERVGGNFFASPVCVGGRLFCISAAGEVVVLEASDQFRLLARNPLGELSRATPAVASGRMYLRTEKRLYSIGGVHSSP